MLSFQNTLNVISLERGDFKFSIGSLNNKFLYMVIESLNILQLALCLQIQDFNMVADVKEAAQRIMSQKRWRKKICEAKKR